MNHGIQDQLTWQEKLEILKTITPMTFLAQRKPGDWMVTAEDRFTFEGGTRGAGLIERGHGSTPEEAVEDDFEKMTTLAPGYMVGLDDGNGNRRHFQWNPRTMRFDRKPTRQMQASA